MSTLYPFDQTGFNPANKITNEEHVVSSINGTDHNYIVPRNAPFFKESISVIDVDSGEFLDDTEFECTHHFAAGDDALARKVYGSITLLDANRTGTFKIEYQTLGGEFVTNLTQAITNGIAALVSLRTADWEDIAGVPPAFPVTAHTQPVTDVSAVAQIIDVMYQIKEGVVDPNNAFTLDDVTDINPSLITPLLQAIQGVSAAITGRAYGESLASAISVAPTIDTALGSKVADIWFDIAGISVTAPENGHYEIKAIPVTRAIDETTPVQLRYLVDGVPVSTSQNLGLPKSLAKNQTLTVQGRALGSNIGNYYISRDGERFALSILRIGI